MYSSAFEKNRNKVKTQSLNISNYKTDFTTFSSMVLDALKKRSFLKLL